MITAGTTAIPTLYFPTVLADSLPWTLTIFYHVALINTGHR